MLPILCARLFSQYSFSQGSSSSPWGFLCGLRYHSLSEIDRGDRGCPPPRFPPVLAGGMMQ